MTSPPTVANLTPWQRVAARAHKNNNAQLDPSRPKGSEQIRTPPQSDKRAGKRRASILHSPETSPVPRPAHIGLIPLGPLTRSEPAAKKARINNSDHRANSSAAPTGLLKPQASSKIALAPVRTPPSRLERPGQSFSTSLSSPTQEHLSSFRVSPPIFDFTSLVPPSPSTAALDPGPAEPALEPVPTIPDKYCSLDRIVIDFEDMEPCEFFELPSLFLDQVAARRKAHEESGTNESKVRALVLKAIEDDMRRKWKGP